ncbi:F5/8 type C domain-containing protein [Paenibacillus tianmuensis]|uniref:F5/8 type C domain-containing protein n=1 Tax=Paenibacillus tianmuensis TaxID=624147 RepID=A0A1G4QA39_9BACL|nr:F5/8 type C domain-containing protein [Paenibacillus tianmuensis]
MDRHRTCKFVSGSFCSCLSAGTRVNRSHPNNIKDGYKLDGTVNEKASYATAVFVSPFIAASTTNSSHQAWINAGWDWMKNKKEGYFSDSFNLLSMLFISGNWWIPTSDGPSTEADLAKGKAGEASSLEGSGYEASKAFDGDPSTRWASKEENDPQWIYVNLGKTYSIHKVKLNWEAAYGKNYKIQVSNDSGSPVNWTDVYSKKKGKGGVEEIAFAAQDARYVRMYGTARGTSYGYSLYEFEVYGSDK